MRFLLIIPLLVSSPAWAGAKIALVKLVRGQVDQLTLGKTTPLKLDDWVEEGAVVKTGERSFVKLLFTDKSSMNVGPASEMKIEKFNGKEAGVIDMVKGQVRSQVTKDYLQIQEKDKSKLFIKTQNAVMGVRGTDFMVTTNGQNTATVLFEGEVVFNHLTDRSALETGKLEDIVDRGVRIMPGEFSVVEADRFQPTVPAVLNVKQRETLESNTTFESGRNPSSQAKETRSIVPDGLSGQEVSNPSDALKKEVANIAPAHVTATSPVVSNASGFVAGDTIKPANGSFLHLESGMVIPPAPGSVFDKNTNSFIPAPGNGSVSSSGNYVPPQNVTITNDGKIFLNIPTAGENKIVEVARPAPVIAPASVSLTQVAQIAMNNPAIIQGGSIAVTPPPPAPMPTPNMTMIPPPSGGIDLNTAVIQRTNGNLNIDIIK